MLYSVIGQANWLANQSHRDRCFDVLNLSCCINKNPAVNDLIDANLMFKKIKSKYSRLVFLYLGSIPIYLAGYLVQEVTSFYCVERKIKQ